MKEMIKITEKDGKQLVSARELYDALGLNKSQWSRWCQSNIVANEYFLETKDWVGFDIVANGNETKDYALSLEFAKHLAMMARTEKSHEIRNYFIECEKIAKNALETQVPKTLSQALYLAAQQAEIIEKQQELIEVQTPKAESFDEMISADGLMSMQAASGVLGYGRNKFMAMLRGLSILQKNNIAYRQYIDRGYFEEKVRPVNGVNHTTTFITPKGIEYLRKKLKE